MPETDYLIRNCAAEDFEYACPKQWSELKPSMMAAVRDCHHCHRKVYLCTTDADLKLYTSLRYCIAVVKPQTQAEKEWAARFESSTVPAGSLKPGFKGETLMGVMHPRDSTGRRQAPALRTVPMDLDAYEIPAYLRKQAE